ncbi:MAG: ABC transporter permease, partial [Opitutae bacterium]
LGLANLPIRIRGIFSTDRFVVNWSLSHYLTAALIAFVVVMLASYFPARRAARLEPADVIRGTSA